MEYGQKAVGGGFALADIFYAKLSPLFKFGVSVTQSRGVLCGVFANHYRNYDRMGRCLACRAPNCWTVVLKSSSQSAFRKGKVDRCDDEWWRAIK
jgi:hypothetical protein